MYFYLKLQFKPVSFISQQNEKVERIWLHLQPSLHKEILL
jgi:hypothetical protein